MSLFENDEYRWRETYFILFNEQNRPLAKDVAQVLLKLDPRYKSAGIRDDDQGRFESMTLLSPDDFSAMDITCLAGEEVIEQAAELAKEMKATAASEEERKKLLRLTQCTARFEVYHFEQILFEGSGEEEEEEFLDPGSLLIVLDRLAEICEGIVVDPQSGSLL